MIGTILEEIAGAGINIHAHVPPSFARVQMGSRREGRAVWALFANRRATPSVIIKVDHSARYRHRLVAEHEALTAFAATRGPHRHRAAAVGLGAHETPDHRDPDRPARASHERRAAPARSGLGEDQRT